MFTDDEKDYIMRMIKEIARVLASVMLGKKYVQVELPVESKYQISGDKLHHMKTWWTEARSTRQRTNFLTGSITLTKKIWQKLCFSTNMLHPKGMNFWKRITIPWRK